MRRRQLGRAAGRQCTGTCISVEAFFLVWLGWIFSRKRYGGGWGMRLERQGSAERTIIGASAARQQQRVNNSLQLHKRGEPMRVWLGWRVLRMRWSLGLALWQGAGRAINRRPQLNRATNRRCSITCIDWGAFLSRANSRLRLGISCATSGVFYVNQTARPFLSFLGNSR
jgi:hypothetical protein